MKRAGMRLKDLQHEKFEILRFLFVEECGVVGCLGFDFHYAHSPSTFLCGVGKHLLKEGEGHVMRARAGSKITAAFHKLHA